MMNDLKNNVMQVAADTAAALNGLGSPALHAVRGRGAAALDATEFPTSRHEEWKYTNLTPLSRVSFRTRSSAEPVDASAMSMFPAEEYPELLVFVNGHHAPEVSRVAQSGVRVTSLHAGGGDERMFVDAHLGSLIAPATNAFVASNTACISDGALVRIPKDTVVSHPIVILSLVDARSAATLVQPRHLIEVGENAQASFVFCTKTLGTNASLSNVVTEMFLRKNAQCSWTLLQDDTSVASMVNTMHVMQEAHSVSRGMTVTLGGAVVRNDVSAMMTESASEANMLGVYCITGETLADNHTVMDHRVAHCLSNELFKGIVSGNARGVFNGKIFVRQDAQKTLAYQSNRNIVLSETASVNTKPQLEIFADDVKCSHGCTVGTIDEEAMFYAQSRGIGKEEARALLLAAFVEDVTNNIPHDHLRELVNRRLEEQLRSE
ncbi:MAG: Fe-S cluster assembly protein SufD [Candidatus Kapaibacterium sp.]